MSEDSRSEFGAGLVVCLAKFSEHLWGGGGAYTEEIIHDFNRYVEMPERRRDKEREEAAQYPSGSSAAFLRNVDIAGLGEGMTPERTLSHLVEIWLNGASDHFYELDRELAPDPLVQLADLTLEAGHGFTDKVWGMDTVQKIRDLWRDSCLELDEKLGAEPDWGNW